MRKATLKNHIKIVHEGKKHKCFHCGKEFSLKINLTAHMLVHSDEKNYKCDQCNKCFKRKGELKLHLGTKMHYRYIHSEKLSALTCSYCNKTFISKSGLESHMFTHSGKVYTCEACNKKFSRPMSLSQHIRRKHENQELHLKCQFCDQSFYSTSDFGAHVRKHIGENPFPCSECSKEFSQKYLLLKHIQKVHENGMAKELHEITGSMKSELCSNTFTGNKSLAQHSMLHNVGKEIKCRPCIVLLKKLVVL